MKNTMLNPTYHPFQDYIVSILRSRGMDYGLARKRVSRAVKAETIRSLRLETHVTIWSDKHSIGAFDWLVVPDGWIEEQFTAPASEVPEIQVHPNSENEKKQEAADFIWEALQILREVPGQDGNKWALGEIYNRILG